MAPPSSTSKAAAADRSTPTTLHVSGPHGTSSSSKAEVVLRGMLSEQKRECATLHANCLFKEFWQKRKQPHDGPPPVIDDLEAEGQARLFDVINRAAEARETARAGVWSGTGAYTNLGEMAQVEGSAAAHMPHLNRDDLAAAQCNANGPRHQQQQRRARMSRTGSTGHGVTTVTTAAVTQAVAVAAAAAEAEAPCGGKGGTCQAAAKLLHHKTLVQFSTAERLEASFPAAAVRQAERRQRAAKARPHTFFNESRALSDLADAAGSYGSCSSLAAKKKQLPGAELVKRRAAAAAAEADAAQARAAADATLPSTQRSAHRRSVAVSSAGDSKHAFFITQQAPAALAGSTAVTPRCGRLQLGAASVSGSDAAAAGAGHSGQAARSAHPRMSVSLLPEDVHATHSLRSSTCQDGRMHDELSMATLQQQQRTRCLAEQLAQPRPAFQPLTSLTAQPREIGDAQAGSNPVTELHNEFVGVRHAGFTALQESLWERSQTRAEARADPAGSAAFNRSLLAHLVQQGGRLAPGWLPGTTPESPFARAAKQQQAQAAAVTAAAAEAAASAATVAGQRPIKPAELELLQQFYAALCGLVERMRLSDPLCLTLVHHVKLLLEGGALLQPALTQQVVGCVAEFTTSCGLRRHNAFVLPLLAFICRCTGTSQADFGSMVAAAGIQAVVWHPQAQAAAAAAAGEGAALLDVSTPPGWGSPRAVPARPGGTQGRHSSSSSSGRPNPGASQPQEQCAGTPRADAPARTSSSGQQTTAAGDAQGTSPPSAMSPRRAAASAAMQGGSHCGSKRGGSSSGASTSRASGSGGNSSSGSGGVVAASLPGINLAAAAAVAELAAAVTNSAPATQRALADAAGADAGSLKVRVRGVAGLVDVSSGADGGAGRVAVHLDVAEALLPSGAEAAADDEADAALPDLGAYEGGLPLELSRRQRQQEGVEGWSQAALEAQQHLQEQDQS